MVMAFAMRQNAGPGAFSIVPYPNEFAAHQMGTDLLLNRLRIPEECHVWENAYDQTHAERRPAQLDAGTNVYPMLYIIVGTAMSVLAFDSPTKLRVLWGNSCVPLCLICKRPVMCKGTKTEYLSKSINILIEK